MKESISNAALAGLALTFIGVMSIVFLSSLNYTKAFKIKNRIVDIIEQYDAGYAPSNRSAINNEIESTMKNIGYRVNAENKQCPVYQDKLGYEYQALNSTYNYRYCIYEYNDTRGKYYKVLAYMYLDIPVIGAYLEFPVSGETKVFYGVIDQHGKPNNSTQN